MLEHKIKNVVEGEIIIRGFLSYTLDKERTKEYGRPCRITTKEKLLSADDIQKKINDPKDEIHESGVCLLYAFHGKVNGKTMNFDNVGSPTVKTLGYSIATVRDKILYATFKLREDLEDSSPFIKEYDAEENTPDLMGAVRASKIEIGGKLQTRSFRDSDIKLFELPYMRLIYPEPGVFAKHLHLYMPDATKVDSKRVKRKGGRPPNADRPVMMELKSLQTMLTEWDMSKSKYLSGFRMIDRKPSVALFEKKDDDGLSRVKVKLQQFKITLAYLSADEEGVPFWETYKDWESGVDTDTLEINAEVRTELIKLLAAF